MKLPEPPYIAPPIKQKTAMTDKEKTAAIYVIMKNAMEQVVKVIKQQNEPKPDYDNGFAEIPKYGEERTYTHNRLVAERKELIYRVGILDNKINQIESLYGTISIPHISKDQQNIQPPRERNPPLRDESTILD